MAKITNGQNVENFEKREKLLIGWFVSVTITIVLAVISLILNYGVKNEVAGNICMFISLLTFFVSIIFRNMRDKLVVKEKEEKVIKVKENKQKNNNKTDKKAKNKKKVNK